MKYTQLNANSHEYLPQWRMNIEEKGSVYVPTSHFPKMYFVPAEITNSSEIKLCLISRHKLDKMGRVNPAIDVHESSEAVYWIG